MLTFDRFVLITGALLLAGCASDGRSFTNEELAAIAGSEDTQSPAATTPPPAAQQQPAARTTPSPRSTAAAAKPPAAKPDKTARAKPAADKPAAGAKASPFNGSWQFSNGQKACMMTLAAVGGSSGTVSASGDCWSGYTKAKGWKLQGNEMVLTDSGNQPLARLQTTGATRYDGYGADGEPVVLVR